LAKNSNAVSLVMILFFTSESITAFLVAALLRMYNAFSLEENPVVGPKKIHAATALPTIKRINRTIKSFFIVVQSK
jgi:hypothetical protein